MRPTVAHAHAINRKSPDPSISVLPQTMRTDSFSRVSAGEKKSRPRRRRRRKFATKPAIYLPCLPLRDNGIFAIYREWRQSSYIHFPHGSLRCPLHAHVPPVASAAQSAREAHENSKKKYKEEKKAPRGDIIDCSIAFCTYCAHTQHILHIFMNDFNANHFLLPFYLINILG